MLSQFMIGAEDGRIYIVKDNKTISDGFSHHAPWGSAAISKAYEKDYSGSVTAMHVDNASQRLITGSKVCCGCCCGCYGCYGCYC